MPPPHIHFARMVVLATSARIVFTFTFICTSHSFQMVTTFLQSLPLAQCLPENSLVTVEAGCRVDAAIKTLQEHGILSCPVMRGVSEESPAGTGWQSAFAVSKSGSRPTGTY